MKRGVERRGSKRFEVKVPATISHPAGDGKGEGCHMLLTRDISNRGAYFTMVKPIFYISFRANSTRKQDGSGTVQRSPLSQQSAPGYRAGRVSK